jgi:ribosomal protein S18 acetylase RimI-like enzyme
MAFASIVGLQRRRQEGTAMTTITIRQATSRDADTLSLLNTDVQALHAAALPHWFKPPGPESFPPGVAAALIAKPANLILLAEAGGEAAGYVYAEVVRQPETPFRRAYAMVYIHHISIRPSHRRQGVGSALIEAVRDAAGELGITLLGADVWSFNEAARSFFRRHGFTTFNERLWTR